MLIKQRGTSDCAIAAIAMFTGLPYEDVAKAGRESGEFHPRTGTSTLGMVLVHLGFYWDNLIICDENNALQEANRGVFRSIRLRTDYLSPALLRDTLWGRTALITTDSLNREGGRHSVYYDGTRLLDPQCGRRGKKFFHEWEDIEPRAAYVWQHPGPLLEVIP